MGTLDADLNHVLAHTGGLWDDLRNARIFITGGTGFFGCWLLETLAQANRELGLNATALILARNCESFARKAPHLAANPAFEFRAGDVRSFEFPSGAFSHVVHAATDASAALNRDHPLLMVETIAQGTQRALEFARHCGARQFLLTSSGAIYGRQPPELAGLAENYPGGPDCTGVGAAYGEGKRLAELLCAIYAAKHGLETKIARCFAFVGPYLPLHTHFAVGNFLRDGLRGDPIQVQGDGTAIRSYLYAADLAIWLWTILLRGQPGQAYNIGSEAAVSIAELAQIVAARFDPAPPVQIARTAVDGQRPERYVPSTARARAELGLIESIALPDALQRTIQWNRAVQKAA